MGDKYVLLGIKLPESYINAAECELARRAIDKYEEGISRTHSYRLSIEEEFLRRYFPVGEKYKTVKMG